MREIANFGNNLFIVEVNINNELREQDLNARIMSKKAFTQLVKNIKKRGGLESLPYCIEKDGVIEIVSGHHRVRACREAGIIDIPVLLDKSNLSRSQIVAKQLAHNSLVGEDDKNILKQLYDMMDNIDDKLESFIDVDELKESLEPMVDIISLNENIRMKTITFLFTEKEYNDIEKILEKLEIDNAKNVKVCDIEYFDKLVKAIEETKKFNSVKNVSVAMYLLLKNKEE